MHRASTAGSSLPALLVAACVCLVAFATPAAADLESKLDEAVLELTVKAALLDKLGSEAFGVDVEAVGRTVVLTGEVEDRATKELAKEVALAVRGVRSVRNKLTLEHKRKAADTPVARTVAKAEGEVLDAVLEVRVKRRLLEEIGRHAMDLEVEAVAGKVTLRGVVPDRQRHRLAIRTARRTKGVDEVIDLIEVE